MSFYSSLSKMYSMKKERNWDTLYFAIDLHDTIIKAGRGIPLTVFTEAEITLKFLSKQPNIVLILYTSTTQEMLEPFYEWCKTKGIIFKYLNENPECSDVNHEGDYSRKFYFNILLDDRAGFNPHCDWAILKDYIQNRLLNH